MGFNVGFVKQKTAYELRISDGSSDVCSSDLGWQVANGSLGHERAMLWLDYSDELDGFLAEMSEAVDGTDLESDPSFVDWYGSVAIAAQALKLLGHSTLANTPRGMVSTAQSFPKIMGSEAIPRAREAEGERRKRG